MSDTAVERNPALLPLPEWTPPPTTNDASLEWADILTVDLQLYDTDRQKLIDTVSTALQRDGFFYVVGHEITPETVSHCLNQNILTLINNLAS